MTLIVLLPDAGDLKRNDPVYWHGYTVGRVVQIEPLIENQVGVTIRINEDYASQITRGTTFTLKRAALFGYIGTNAIEIETPSEPGLPFTPGDKVQGISPPKPTLVEQGKQAALEYWQQLKTQAAALRDAYKDSPYRKEIQAALDELGALAEEGTRQAKGGLDQFRKDHQKDFDQVLKKLEEARDWIRKKGDEPGARKIEEEIGKLKK